MKWGNPITDYQFNKDVRFEVFTAVTMKNAVFGDVTPRGSCKKRCFGGTYHVHDLHSVLQFLVSANVPSSQILVTLMMEAIHSSETSALTGTTWCNIPEGGILQLFKDFSTPFSEVTYSLKYDA
jgi:hypothetical protein